MATKTIEKEIDRIKKVIKEDAQTHPEIQTFHSNWLEGYLAGLEVYKRNE